MTFHRSDYLDWYIPRAQGGSDVLNLHSSGVPLIDPATLELPTGDPWAIVGRFEAALAAWLGLDPGEILFTPGATGGNLLALLTLTGRDDEIVVEQPIYEPMMRHADRVGRLRRLNRHPDHDWRWDPAEARRLITDRTRLVLITEPHNPSGVFAPREDVLALAELAAARGATLLINEVYLRFSDRPGFHGAAENIVVVSSLSKLFGTYPFRLGWLSARKPTIETLRAGHRSFSIPAAPAAAVGLAVLALADDLLAEARRRVLTGVETVDQWVRQTAGLSWTRPQGPGYGCVLLSGEIDDVALAERLHTEQQVLVVPGTWFEVPGSLRLSWLQCDADELATGLARIASVL